MLALLVFAFIFAPHQDPPCVSGGRPIIRYECQPIHAPAYTPAPRPIIR